MRVSIGLQLSAVLCLLGCGGDRGLDGRGVTTANRAALDTGGATTCDPSRLPMNRPDPLACCLDGDEAWFVFGGVPARLVHRLNGNPCTSDGVTGSCVGPACIYGPCGATNVRVFAPPAHVFYPHSDPTVCGRQATGYPGQPEEWTPASVSYPGVTPTCPFNACTATGPAIRVTVTALANDATGSIESHPEGIAIKGAGEAEWAFKDADFRFTAGPLGPHARATFTGGCVATGDYGQEVVCKQLVRVIGPDSLPITVTYDCEPGFTCKNKW